MRERRWLRLAWGEYQGHDCLRVSGWAAADLRGLGQLTVAEAQRRLAVFPTDVVEAGADLRALQPVAGRFERDGDAVCFIPRFPFVDDTSYTLFAAAMLDEGDPGGLESAASLLRPARAGAPETDVLAIYPSAAHVPVNLLKLYVHFSQPMSEGWAARAVHVHRTDSGEALHGVFLPPKPELWDRERRRLTLFLDPGRIKRGLAPHEEAGYPLIEGVPVIITIDAAFRDAAERPLRTSAGRRYDIGPPLRQRAIPADWRVHCPAAGSREPLTLAFDRPLDHALLQHALTVCDAAGAPIAGKMLVGPDEQSWQFAPALAWEAGQYVVNVDPRLEDLAGNSVARVFDRDLSSVEDTPVAVETVSLTFRPWVCRFG